jgi:hypothetical protein
LERKKIAIAIPASLVSDAPHLREKTSKIGLIGRAAAIFRVKEIIIYPDDPKADQKKEMDLIATLLSYIETPQYLRKRLFKLRPELRYVGTLPPLRTPHHPTESKIKDLKVGGYREGIVLAKTEKGSLIDIGVEKLALIPNKKLAINQRVTVKILDVKKRPTVELADKKEIPTYWGYKVTVTKQPFGKLVKNLAFDLTIATSKYGIPVLKVLQELIEKWRKAQNVLIAFGSPSEGLYEIVRHEGLDLDDVVDFSVNTIPKQGTKTVRTEEAVVASLAILNMHFSFNV